ncbi:MAG: hypothetical protein IK028_05550 [Bacilli bacterium]|nr:hypothetical protein [Bacilli bacterium]
MSENGRRWGHPLGVVSLVFGIIALVFGLFALIPLLGLVFAVITGIVAVIALGFGIPGIIGSTNKTRAIVGVSFGGLMLAWAIVRYYWVVAVLAAAAAAA